LKRLAQEMLSNQARPGLGALLSPLLALPVSDQTPDDQKSLFADIMSLQQAMTHHDVPRAVEVLSRLLGMGQGLTPSGDDFVIGLLLMLNRWPDAVWPGGDRRTLNRQVVHAAYDKTTTLSANLIECAASGQADERLVDVVDGILTGQPAESECASNLRRWGSSSGIDALVGMTVAAQV
jgi:hypothetical protein